VEVKQGALLIGMGDRLDIKKTIPVGVGDTGTAPAGPYTITYVNAYEVPRQRSFPSGY
jgi:hypothetical protein